MKHDYDFHKSRIKKELDSNEMLKMIFNYAGKIAEERNLNKILMLMADMGRDLVTADRCSVWVCNEEKKEIWTKAAHGVSTLHLPIDKGIVGHAIKNCKAEIINDPYKNPYFEKEIDKQTGYKTENMIVIPIINNSNRTIGVYQAINKVTKEGIFSQNDLERLLLASSYTANTLEAAMLREEVELTQKEMIYTLSEVCETRSKETGNHVKRVAEYSRILALAYGLDEKEADLIRIASPMHDIGKIGIKDAILVKPSRLTKEERKIIQTHTTVGYEMLKHSKRLVLQASAIIAHQHHEKWDGTGYPRKLKGNEIHIYGSITAIADVFDALGDDRIYKKAWPLDRIVNLFKEEREKHFHPELLDVFLDKLGDLVTIGAKYKDEFQSP